MDQNKLAVCLDVSADLLTWLAVYQNLSLALRHPERRGRAADEMMRSFLEQLGQGMVRGGLMTAEEMEALELANLPDAGTIPRTGKLNA